MQIKRLNLVYFSPTRTTQKVLKAFSESNIFSGIDCIQNDLTYPDFQENFKTIEPGDLVVFGMPVYAGRVPEIAMERFEKINTNSCPVVLIAVYGNRHYDEALIEMQEMASNKEMKTIAAAAFIGEHSYSTDEYPTAAGRPDQEDIKKAQNFANNVLQKLESLKSENEISAPKLPGVYPLPERRQLPDAFAETNYDKCVKCKKCINLCPTGAIQLTDKIETIAEKCIICCACIKACPTNARLTRSEQVKGFSKLLSEKFSQRKEPELFC